VRPAITKGVSVMVSSAPEPSLTTAHEVDDLDAVPLSNDRGLERVPLEDTQIMLDRNPARVDRQAVEQIGDRQRLVDIEGFAVERDTQLEPGL
jgi:hypothetical protein